MSRPLTLHVSALNDAEYTTYTSSIHDIVETDAEPTTDYDKLAVGVREARAWLRGRYPALASHTLDSILRLFSPDLGPADVLTGGQFFAALRLVSHVLSGKEMDPSLVFVQAHPDEITSRSPSPLGKRSRVPSPVNNPFSINGGVGSNPLPGAATINSAPVKPVPPSLPPKPTNPFLNRRASQDLPPQSAPAGTAVFPGGRSGNTQDSKIPPLPPRKPPVIPPPRHASMGPQHPQPTTREPPPPVPAFPHLPRSVSANTTNTLIQQSLQATRIAQSLKKAEQKLEQERIMEVLKSSSAPPRRVRSKSPAKTPSSSASSSAPSASGSAERTITHRRVPSLPPRRNLSPPASTVGGSVRSFEQVATASLSPFKRATMASTGVTSSTLPPEPPMRRFASPSNSPSRTPPRPLTELPPEPPPTHPDRKAIALSVDTDRFAPSNASPRVGRSKSLHHPSPPPVPPPPRRKRPESAQLTPTSSPHESPFANPPDPHSGSPSPSHLMLSRHLSLSTTRQREREREQDRERERGRDAFSDTLSKTFTSLSLRAQPALDTARFKAEGAFSRRGFVQHGAGGPRWMRSEGERGLMDDVEGSPGPDDDADSSLDHDADQDSVEERARRWREGGVDVAVVEREEGRPGSGRKMVLERDDLKWPAGDGWKPL
ncbi:hypothetical protein L226DRAFT_537099 [Lentinus tigrinus ALCF2SS1-7]|uniref:Uncharacterized protein n=1 Tax=Lentinus tigrinus ALCF2SS1-6 TaxID=1328759 RepID=A0A5C2RVA4_9APHY|nr:hypothetical protein L227DRAFT_509838 [Lentinus tigrinus ALCF2SS1-6]RPD72596.1 hypothetical protein L226DRAFT_537099 [Lentinus tigrinus ALCF2SS1-7]